MDLPDVQSDQHGHYSWTLILTYEDEDVNISGVEQHYTRESAEKWAEVHMSAVGVPVWENENVCYAYHWLTGEKQACIIRRAYFRKP